ncbi:MAG TPA: choice-of-anchor Q domain-containing protein, partial [Methylomirabilota bacterium]|nr:choice-of-anchor Q domain-containing protein [Methylomirabilota bacterium]
HHGGGAADSVLNNCTIFGNSCITSGGGAFASALTSCILANNSAKRSSEEENCLLDHCWLGEPGFVNPTSGNLRQWADSPCINAGRNLSAPGGTDLDGNPRVVGGTVDIGAYEFQSPQSLIAYLWLQDYGLPINPATDSADADGDRLNNYQEWRAGTDPTDALSALRLLTPVQVGSNLVVRWESVEDKFYLLERSTNITSAASFAPFVRNIPGEEDFTTYTDTNAATGQRYFYRVGVE